MKARRLGDPPRTFAYAGRAMTTNYLSIWPDDVFTCRCGWSGTTDDLSTEMFDAVIDGRCQMCDTMLLVRPLGATLAEAQKALERGHPYAAELVAMLQPPA